MALQSEPPIETRASREQIVYANLLTMGAWSGVFVLLVTYLIYVSGLLAPYVPLEKVPEYWGQGVAEYRTATGSPRGWGWAELLDRGDYLNYAGFVLLGLTTIVCYFTLVVRFWKTKNRVLLVICTLEVIVLGVAASGILGGGGH